MLLKNDNTWLIICSVYRRDVDDLGWVFGCNRPTDKEMFKDIKNSFPIIEDCMKTINSRHI